MITLNEILVTDNGKRIDYAFTAISDASKFVNEDEKFYIEYLENIASVPKSILAIPFISNWLPVAWFAGFDIVVDEIDSKFYDSMMALRDEFAKQFPDYDLKGSLKANTLVENECIGEKSAMLFSGGVDAYATYIRVRDKKPDLVTILGADIEIGDIEQWERFKTFMESEELLSKNEKQYITTNVRNFYTYHVELLLKDIGWWGKVQHGLSLIGSLAPLSFIKGYKSVYIASSYTKEIQIAWGSTPKTDETIRWCGTQVFHDGYELKRQDKVDLIATFAKTNKVPFRLRVCYSELRTDFNCSNCEKCFRTILGILLNNEDPNSYGFVVDETIYDKIFAIISQGGASRGMQYFWLELKNKANETDTFFVFKDKALESAKLDRIRNGELNSIIEAKLKDKTGIMDKVRFIARNRFPWLRTIYRKIRY
ncbi:MAG: hypothetical protein KDD31_06090 [Muricauda sp.]|nr:hypothetical protein [Allomuricauda sp.]